MNMMKKFCMIAMSGFLILYTPINIKVYEYVNTHFTFTPIYSKAFLFSIIVALAAFLFSHGGFEIAFRWMIVVILLIGIVLIYFMCNCEIAYYALPLFFYTLFENISGKVKS